MKDMLDIASKITDPLAVASLCALIFFSVIKLMIKKGLIPQAEKGHAKEIILTIINKLFILSLAGMIMGFSGFLLVKLLSNMDKSQRIERAEEEGNKLQTTVALSTNILQLYANSKLPDQRTNLVKAEEKLHSQVDHYRKILKDNTYYNIAPSPQSIHYLNAAEETITSVRWALSADIPTQPVQVPDAPAAAPSYSPVALPARIEPPMQTERPADKPLPHTIAIPVLIATNLVAPNNAAGIGWILNGDSFIQLVHRRYMEAPRMRYAFDANLPNIPVTFEQFEENRDCPQPCITTILREKILQLQSGSLGAKREALADIAFIVARIHEPLCCTALSEKQNSNRKIFILEHRPTTLGTIWHSTIPASIISDSDDAEYAHGLVENYGRDGFEPNSQAASWITGSHRQAVEIYRKFGNRNYVHLTNEYLVAAEHREIMNRQLLFAGKRLAYILNYGRM
ncbi:S1/P1 nuclease [Pseudoduganella ginsengisoli]|nr:S1/P1 nuclease [Pseudoduganella ginsengisoli]